jgi:hypothetical protein
MVAMELIANVLHASLNAAQCSSASNGSITQCGTMLREYMFHDVCMED